MLFEKQATQPSVRLYNPPHTKGKSIMRFTLSFESVSVSFEADNLKKLSLEFNGQSAPIIADTQANVNADANFPSGESIEPIESTPIGDTEADESPAEATDTIAYPLENPTIDYEKPSEAAIQAPSPEAQFSPYHGLDSTLTRKEILKVLSLCRTYKTRQEILSQFPATLQDYDLRQKYIWDFVEAGFLDLKYPQSLTGNGASFETEGHHPVGVKRMKNQMFQTSQKGNELKRSLKSEKQALTN